MFKNLLDKPNLKKSIVYLSMLSLFLSVVFSLNSSAENHYSDVIEVYGMDTVAGYSTSLRTSKTSASSPVTFTILKPNGETLKLQGQTDSYGVAQIELSDYYTRTAGIYSASAAISGMNLNSRESTFKVYPDKVSVIDSVVSPEDQTVSLYGGKGKVTVKITDEFENPIEGHTIRLISSRSGDVITSVDPTGITNKDGEISFELTSNLRGISTYSVYDVSADVTLEKKAKIVYYDSANYVFSETPQVSFGAIIAPSGLADHFEFIDIASSVAPDTSTSFTLNALDSSSSIVTNYVGTVRFSALLDNASFANLPNDYTFTAQNLGKHTFSLAISFDEPGTYTVEARDTVNNSIFGRGVFNVIQGSSAFSENGEDNPVILNPASGTYSNAIQVISGESKPGASLKIFDGENEIGELTADVEGKFSYTTNILADGKHIFKAAEVSEIGTILSVSDSVEVNVDTNQPEILSFELNPVGSASPSSTVTVKIVVSEELSNAALLLSNDVVELTRSADGRTYTGSFVAPVTLGEYPLTFVLMDQLGNESRVSNQYKLTVSGAASIGDAANLSATASDRKVTLTWSAPQTGVSNLKNYRVYYGFSPNQLTEAVDTFTPSPSWYIPNLRNGVEYFFGVVAIDNLGNTSQHFSNIVSAVPNPNAVSVTPPNVLNGSAGEDALGEMQTDASNSGPEMTWLFILSLLGGSLYMLAPKFTSKIKNRIDF